MTRGLLFLLLAGRAAAGVLTFNNNSATVVADVNGQAITPASVTASTITDSSLPAQAVVYTDTGGTLRAVSTFSYVSGSVGIGAASPATTLDVNGNAQFGSGVTRSTFSTSGALTMATNTTLTADSETVRGRLGVGTASPCSTCTLHVIGGASIDGNFNAGSSTLTVAGGNVAINYGATTPDARLAIKGTSNTSYIMLMDGTEDIYLRGGKSTSDLYLNDVNARDVYIGKLTRVAQFSAAPQIRSFVSPTGYALTIDSKTVVAASIFGITGGGHIVSSGTTPTIACNAGTPTVAADSSDMRGKFLSGIGAVNCTVTFVNAWAKAPVCVATTDAATPIALSITTANTTSIVITALAAMTGDNISYLCLGAP